jgi:Tol biopolymer transport system component
VVIVYKFTRDGTQGWPSTGPPAGGRDVHPSFSPNGRNVAFERSRNAFTENEINQIYSVGVGSGSIRQLTECSPAGDCLGDDEPDWSPNGARIAFFRAKGPLDENGNAAFVAIFTMRRDGSDVQQVTQRMGGVGAEDHFPSWSPNGKRIAFERIDFSTGKAHAKLYVVRADGTHLRRIDVPARVQPGADEISWSPTGRRILFSTGCTFGFDCPARTLKESEIFSVRVDGSQLRQLTHTKHGRAFSAAWSPNGKRIVFARHVGGGRDPFTDDLYTMRTRGGGLRRLTHAPKREPHHPDWESAP